MARYGRDWFHAEIVQLRPDGDYLVRWVKPKSGYVDHSATSLARGPVAVVEPEDIRPMQQNRGVFSGY